MSDRIIHLDENLLSCIFSYLTAKDLCQMSMACKAFASTGQHPSLEAVWKALVDKRFGLNDRTRKTVGLNNQKNMKELYTLLHYRKQIPDGKFTSKQNFVFGKGGKTGILAWLVVAPSTNAILRPTSFQGEQVHKMELRFCIQNIHHDAVKLSLRDDFISIGCITSEEIKDGRLHNSSFKVLSKNGNLINSAQPLLLASAAKETSAGISQEETTTLKLLEYAVISCQVYCPQSVENEPDLLTMITNLQFSFDSNQVASGACSQDVNVVVNRVPDEDVWSQYVALPSGVVMLRDKSASDWK